MRRGLGIDVYEAAKARIRYLFERFSVVTVSFSGGKDSTVMLYLVAEVAEELGRRFSVMFLDLEAQYAATIEHIAEMREHLGDTVEFCWICLPLALRNACSVFEPSWICWDSKAQSAWVRKMPPGVISDPSVWTWFRPGMEFEEFVPAYESHVSNGRSMVSMVGIRSQESLHRWRTVSGRSKRTFRGKAWTTWRGGAVYAAYPIYDWQTEDVWTYIGRRGAAYNRVYDLMQAAGVSLHKQRICQPYGDDQRQGLWLYQILEPETWPRVLSRVSGANSGALYSRQRGNIQGRGVVTKPPGASWEGYAKALLATMPEQEREHYELKIDRFVLWYRTRGYPDGIPDEDDAKEEEARRAPSWRRVAKTILKNDHTCKGLGFSPHTSRESYLRWKRSVTWQQN